MVGKKVKVSPDKTSQQRKSFQIPWKYNWREAFKTISHRLRLENEDHDRQGNMADLGRKILEQYILCVATKKEIEEFGLLDENEPMPHPLELLRAIDGWKAREE